MAGRHVTLRCLVVSLTAAVAVGRVSSRLPPAALEDLHDLLAEQWTTRELERPGQQAERGRRLDTNSIVTRASDPNALPPRTADMDVFGMPLDPDEFAAAASVEVSLSEQAPSGAVDPIEMAELFEGDISGVADDELAVGRNAIQLPEEKWPEAQIPYVIASGFSARERLVIASAVLEFERNTCLRLLPLAPGAGAKRGHVHIIKGDGCFSSVGRKGDGSSSQQLSLGEGCLIPGIVVHEFMHAAGFWHEQSRPDRDEHVIVHWNNIKASLRYNFSKYTWRHVRNLSEPYDIGSIMHYGEHAFATDRSLPTISAIHPTSAQMGQRNALSLIDINKLNKLYECDGVTSPPPVVRPLNCTDDNQFCRGWADEGECTNNPLYMRVHCALSCDTCPEGGCRDHSDFCATWADRGECVNRPSYMSVYCRTSCGMCSEGDTGIACADYNSGCGKWAASGECTKNPSYMTVYCRQSCSNC